MDAQAWHRHRDLTMWSVHGHQFNQRCPPRTAWWNDNRGRQTTAVVVLQYLRSGRAVYRAAGEDRNLTAGDLFLFAYDEDSLYGRPPDLPTWPGHDELLVTDHVAFRGAGLREHWGLLRARQGSIIALPPRSPFLAAMYAVVEPDQRPACERVAALVGALAGVVEDAAGASRSPVARAIDAILADPCHDHNLKAIAERCGCSREHLSRVFQEQIGMPPGLWMRQRRIERAVSLLRDTDLPIGEVAARCGAGSLHRLARWTRQVHGQAPAALRRRQRSGR